MFEPGSRAWWNAVRVHAPHLHSSFAPWERITTDESVRDLLIGAGIPAPVVVAEAGQQNLRTADDWWSIVMGSGYRWTVDQMNGQIAEQVRHDCTRQIRDLGAKSIETNVIYATARKTIS